MKTKRQLEAENQVLKQENKELKEQIIRLEIRIKEFENELIECRRASFRQAAPFRRPERNKVQNPKKPGQKDGHPPAYRRIPEFVDEEITVPLERCPHCAHPIYDVKEKVQYIEEIPEIRVKVTKLTTFEGQCPHCGTVESQHPLKVSSATGAAGVQIGPRALALGTDLNKRLGLSTRKTCEVLQYFNLHLTAGGFIQALHRVAQRLSTSYEQLLSTIRTSSVVYTDETSWWVGGPGWWLWVFTTKEATLYVVEETRGQQVVWDILTADYKGTMVSDCLSTYDPQPFEKHKCYAHHLKAISEAIGERSLAPNSFLPRIRLLLKTAIIWKEMKPKVSEEEYLRRAGILEAKVDQLLNMPHHEPGEQQIANRLLKQRKHLFTFLYKDEVEATNNRAERQLRPAVISRKISCGNKTRKGKRTWEVLTSLAATLHQQGRSFVDFLVETIPLSAHQARARPALC